MKLKLREVQIIKYISLQEKGCSIQTLVSHMNLSDMIVRNCLKQIDLFLGANELPKLEKNKGLFKLNLEEEREILDNLLYSSMSFTSEDRIFYILLELALYGKINLSQCAKVFDITRQTLSNDLNNVKKILERNRLTLVSKEWRGIFLEGDHSSKGMFKFKTILKFVIENYDGIKISRRFFPYRDMISEDMEIKFLKFSKKLISVLSASQDTYFFNAILASLIFLKANEHEDLPLKIFFPSIPAEVEKMCMYYWEKIRNIEEFEEIGFLEPKLDFCIILFRNIFPDFLRFEILYEKKY